MACLRDHLSFDKLKQNSFSVCVTVTVYASIIHPGEKKNQITWHMLRPTGKGQSQCCFIYLFFLYLDVCVWDSFDPRKHFLSGLLLRHCTAQKPPQTPGKPSASQGLAASSASSSCPTCAVVHFSPSLTVWFLSVELCSHWGDILYLLTKCCWWTSRSLANNHQLSRSLLQSQSLKDSREESSLVNGIQFKTVSALKDIHFHKIG